MEWLRATSSANPVGMFRRFASRSWWKGLGGPIRFLLGVSGYFNVRGPATSFVNAVCLFFTGTISICGGKAGVWIRTKKKKKKKKNNNGRISMSKIRMKRLILYIIRLRL